MPIRLLRPQLRQSERWNKLPWLEQSLYVRLIMMVDDFGRYEAHPMLVRNEAFPFGDPQSNDMSVQTIDGALLSLCQHDLIALYDVDGKRYLQMQRWTERTRTPSKYPECPHNASKPQAECPHNASKPQAECPHNASALHASPPSPSPSPSSPPSPSPSSPPIASSPHAAGSDGEGEQAVEFPPEFPKTAEAAVLASASVCCPADFTRRTWEKAAGRGGRDAKDVPIRRWQSHLATEWAYQRDRLAREGIKPPEPANAPKVWKIDGRIYTPERGPKREEFKSEGDFDAYFSAWQNQCKKWKESK